MIAVIWRTFYNIHNLWNWWLFLILIPKGLSRLLTIMPMNQKKTRWHVGRGGPIANTGIIRRFGSPIKSGSFFLLFFFFCAAFFFLPFFFLSSMYRESTMMQQTSSKMSNLAIGTHIPSSSTWRWKSRLQWAHSSWENARVAFSQLHDQIISRWDFTI